MAKDVTGADLFAVRIAATTYQNLVSFSAARPLTSAQRVSQPVALTERTRSCGTGRGYAVTLLHKALLLVARVAGFGER
jgi:hypothetical protein